MAALVAGLVLASGSTTAVWGTTLVPMSDADLVRTSAAIVVGTVRRIQTLERRHGGIVTEVTLRVERRVKGRLRNGKLVVTAPGGQVGDKTAHVFGAPEFTRGERVLVFLKHGPEGRLRTNALALGKYHVEKDSRGRLLARRTEPTTDLRTLDGFLAQLDGLTAGEPEESIGSGRVATPAAEVVGRVEVDRFTYLSGTPYRWFEDTVAYRLANADSGIGTLATQTALTNAMAAWTNVPTATLVIQNGSPTTTARSVAGGICDGVSTIQFDDPFSEVQDLTNCSGVLAVGGYCSSGATMVVNGTTYHRIVEGDVTMNQNVGSCWGATNLTEVLTHEIGHTIGLGHSAVTDATMYAYAHFDGRGAAVRADDAAGATALYPVVSGTTSTTSTSTSSSTSTSRSTTTTSSTSTSRSTSSTSSTSSSSTSSSTSSSSSTAPSVPTTSTSTTTSSSQTTTSSTSTSRTTSTSSSTSTLAPVPTTSTSTSSSTTLAPVPTTSTSSSSTSTSSSSSTSTLAPTTSSSMSSSSTSSTSSTSTSSSSTVPPPPTTSTTLPPGTDADGDGVDDSVDACPATPAGELVDDTGCSVCPCGGMRAGNPWSSRTAYLRCVKAASRRGVADGRMGHTDARDAIRRGLLSTCARATVTRCCVYRPGAQGRGQCRIMESSACDTRRARGGVVLDVGDGSCLPNPCDGR